MENGKRSVFHLISFFWQSLYQHIAVSIYCSNVADLSQRFDCFKKLYFNLVPSLQYHADLEKLIFCIIVRNRLTFKISIVRIIQKQRNLSNKIYRFQENFVFGGLVEVI